MTKKDYEVIANALHSNKACLEFQFDTVLDCLSEALKQDNPRFNARKFKEACREGKHIRQVLWRVK